MGRIVSEKPIQKFIGVESFTMRLVIPDRALTVRQTIERYKAGTLTEKIGFFYDDQLQFQDEDGTPIDVSMMTRIEKFKLHSKKREQVLQYHKDIEAGKPREDVIVLPKEAE